MILPAKDAPIGQGFSTAHQAVDQGSAAYFNTPVYAPHAGKITAAGQMGSGTNDAGLAVDITGGSYKSRLGHLNSIGVKVGQTVKEGQEIGRMGYTGYTRDAQGRDNTIGGTHVHWVLWNSSGTRVDGRNYVTSTPPSSGTGGSKVTTAEATSLINGLTQRVFGKAIDKAGLANYVGHITSGRYTPAKAVQEIIDSPQAQAYLKSKYQTTKTVTKTVDRIVRDPADLQEIAELGRALEIAQANAGSGSSNEDIGYIRQKVDQIWSFITSIFKGKE